MYAIQQSLNLNVKKMNVKNKSIYMKKYLCIALFLFSAVISFVIGCRYAAINLQREIKEERLSAVADNLNLMSSCLFSLRENDQTKINEMELWANRSLVGLGGGKDFFINNIDTNKMSGLLFIESLEKMKKYFEKYHVMEKENSIGKESVEKAFLILEQKK